MSRLLGETMPISHERPAAHVEGAGSRALGYGWANCSSSVSLGRSGLRIDANTLVGSRLLARSSTVGREETSSGILMLSIDIEKTQTYQPCRGKSSRGDDRR